MSFAIYHVACGSYFGSWTSFPLLLKCFELKGVVSGTPLTMRAVTLTLTYLVQFAVEALPRKAGIFKGNLVSLGKIGELAHPEAEMLETGLPVLGWSLLLMRWGTETCRCFAGARPWAVPREQEPQWPWAFVPWKQSFQRETGTWPIQEESDAEPVVFAKPLLSLVYPNIGTTLPYFLNPTIDPILALCPCPGPEADFLSFPPL